MEWREEFERRCRRVLGVDDDTQAVRIRTTSGGGCDTCGPEVDIEISVGAVAREYSDMGELIRALDEVEAPLQAHA